MKRLQPLLLLLGLLFTNLAVGPCDGQPLGSTRGSCTYQGSAHAEGSLFPAGDGCNTCSCIAGGAACTEKACPVDGGGAHVDGGGGCHYNGTHYAEGATFPASDGCNGCSCVGGAVGCTTRGCVLDGGSAGTVACDDGTGATDCCLDTSAGTCSTEGLRCWTRCGFPSADANDGYRGQKVCGGGQWAVGLGLFPCSRASSASDGGSTGTVACGDGTGATDCCPGTSTVGACSADGFSCWTRCNFQSADATDGYRGQEVCSGGQWFAGKGLFPCSRGASDGGGGSVTRCTPGADQTCNDNPMVSALWGHCESTGVCTCNLGTSVSPTTGRCM